jgi:8-oxo-dGTP pyrophosphatase MutT (NUDIX family)
MFGPLSRGGDADRSCWCARTSCGPRLRSTIVRVTISEYVANLRKHVGTEMLMLPSACAVVVDDRGHVLLGRRADTGEWALPAGAIDPGEQPAEAAIREVYEETGVHVVVERLAGVAVREPVTYPNGNICQYLTVWFRCGDRRSRCRQRRGIYGCRLVQPRRAARPGCGQPAAH